MADPLVSGGAAMVSFAAVAKGSSDRTLLAWYAHGATVDLNGVRSAVSIQQMQRVEVGKHYNFTTGGQTWHVTAAEGKNVIVVAVTAQNYPLRHAHGLILDVSNLVSGRALEKAASSFVAEGALNNELRPKLTSTVTRYNDLKQVDQLHATMGKIESVKVVMQESIEMALQNCVALEAIDQKADELQSQAGMFKTRAKKLRSQMWWKKCKVQLLLTVLIIVILAVIIIPIVVMQQQADNASKK